MSHPLRIQNKNTQRVFLFYTCRKGFEQVGSETRVEAEAETSGRASDGLPAAGEREKSLLLRVIKNNPNDCFLLIDLAL